MRVRNVMSEEVETTSPGTPAPEAWQRLRHSGYRHLVVVEGDAVVGILSDRDLGGTRGASMRAGRTVGELMTRDPVTVVPATTLKRAADLLRGRSLGCLPVLSGKRVVGVVTMSDVLDRVGRMAEPRLGLNPVRRTTPRVAAR